MRNKSEDETTVRKLLNPVISIFDMIFNCGAKSPHPKTSTISRKTGNPRNRNSKLSIMEKLNLNGNGTHLGGHTIDKLYVSTEVLGKGSNGTVVFRGKYEGREVAVKRLSRALNKAACNESRNLTEVDNHPNIVRLHSVKRDKDYVYLVLELCFCSLSRLVSLSAANAGHHAEFVKDMYLWERNGYPSKFLLKLMRDMVKGLVRLHELGLIHQDIKPESVMIAHGMDICAKLSGSSSCGQIKGKKLDDMFSLGCVFYFCLSRGGYPFERHAEENINNGSNRMNLHLINHIPEATDLISQLLDLNPKMRPKANQVLHHPLFWDSDKRLSFLRDVSDQLERELRRPNSKILIKLESVAKLVFGARWNQSMESELVKDVGRSRYYRYNSLQDLLRVVRNKLNHYHQSSKNIQELLGQVPDGFNAYFSSRYPRLLMEVYKVVICHCRTENCFEKYFRAE